jgi:hypothetical protein
MEMRAMAVFYDTGGGDIYAGPDRESVLAAIREDIGDDEFVRIEDEIREVSGKTLMTVSDENDEPTEETTTLEEEYGDDTKAYCIASSNG